MIALSVGGIGVGLGLALLIVLSGVTRPLGRMTDAMGRVAGGDFEIEVPALGRRDEVGKLASALQRFKAAGETGSAATHDLAAAGEVSEQSERLKCEVDSFHVAVRAA